MIAATPHALRVRRAGIPLALRKRQQWVNWDFVRRNEKWTKPPFRPSGRRADSTDPATWSTFERAFAAYRDGRFAGIGFVLSAVDPFIGIDLDHVVNINDGTMAKWARKVVATAHAERAYIELSPSATGLHIIGRGRDPQGFAGSKRNDCEVYATDRYLTITGQTLERSDTIRIIGATLRLARARISANKKPAQPSSTFDVARPSPWAKHVTNERLVGYMLESASGEKLRRLLIDGDTAEFQSNSEADAAAAMSIAWWTRLDPERTEQILRESALYRTKWDRHKSYLRMTIANAIRNLGSRCYGQD